jgi:hypothetical protein
VFFLADLATAPPLHRTDGGAKWFRNRVCALQRGGTMSAEGWLAAGFGAVFVLLLFATAIWLIASGRQVPDTVQWILRVVMALAGAGCGAFLSGMLTVDLNVP